MFGKLTKIENFFPERSFKITQEFRKTRFFQQRTSLSSILASNLDFLGCDWQAGKSISYYDLWINLFISLLGKTATTTRKKTIRGRVGAIKWKLIIPEQARAIPSDKWSSFRWRERGFSRIHWNYCRLTRSSGMDNERLLYKLILIWFNLKGELMDLGKGNWERKKVTRICSGLGLAFLSELWSLIGSFGLSFVIYYTLTSRVQTNGMVLFFLDFVCLHFVVTIISRGKLPHSTFFSYANAGWTLPWLLDFQWKLSCNFFSPFFPDVISFFFNPSIYSSSGMQLFGSGSSSSQSSSFFSATTFCPSSSDGVSCWYRTLPGQVAVIPCFSSFNGVNYDTSREYIAWEKVDSLFDNWLNAENASRLCLANGTWAERADYDRCRPIKMEQLAIEVSENAGRGERIHEELEAKLYG